MDQVRGRQRKKEVLPTITSICTHKCLGSLPVLGSYIDFNISPRLRYVGYKRFSNQVEVRVKINDEHVIYL
jgi:hypothetical protein